MIRSLRSLRREKQALPSFLKRPLPTVDCAAWNVEVCKVHGTLAAVLTLIMLETGTVRSNSGEAGVTITLNPSLCL